MVMKRSSSSAKQISSSASSYVVVVADAAEFVDLDFGCRCCYRLSRTQSAFDSFCIASEAFSEITQSDALRGLIFY